MDNYVEIPKGLTRSMLEEEFGSHAVAFYMNRIEERRKEGKTYYNPLKTIYLWATADRRTNQGFYTTYYGFARRRKNKNHGRS